MQIGSLLTGNEEPRREAVLRKGVELNLRLISDPPVTELRPFRGSL
jgi:hypothetical protein